jgi:MoaA/NifB/PqqE/SkfB family radical SAM enzyme
MTTPIPDLIDEGRLGERLWFYANYVCNLACVYCLTESAPNVPARELDADLMRAHAHEAADLGFRAIGVTGGEPFLRRDMVGLAADLADMLPVTVLTNGTLFRGARLEAMRTLAALPVRIQISLDHATPQANDEMRGPENFAKVVDAIPRLVDMGITVRIATTVEEPDPDDLAALCDLHRSLGVPDEDHLVRGIVRRGRALTEGLGDDASLDRLMPELTITGDGAFWSPFGPTIVDGRLDTDLLIARDTRMLAPAAAAMTAVIEGSTVPPPGEDRFT